MNPKDLKRHKEAPKRLDIIPVFRPQKRNKLPRPFKSLGGPRIHATGMIDVSADHVAFMYWRDGPIFTDRSFYSYLFCRLPGGNLSPLFEFHWHPSHKGYHCKTPCSADSDYTNRVLPGAREFALTTNPKADPAKEEDRLALVINFCKLCGISLPDSDPRSERLW